MSTSSAFGPAYSSPLPRVGARPGSALGFAIFVVLNFLLFVRPTEVVPGLVGLELYQATIVICLLFSFPVILAELQDLRGRAITACVLGFNLFLVLSNVVNLRPGEAFAGGVEFFKVVLYFLLCVGLLTTTDRVRIFLWWLAVFVTICALLTVLEYHGLIQLPNLTKLKDGEFIRLRGSGIFADPNDLCVLMAVGLLLALYWLTEGSSGLLARLFWLASLVLMGYAVSLTQSRGGLLAVLAGLAVLIRARFGWRWAIFLGLPLLMGLVLFVGGRQTTLSTEQGTGQDRIQLWSEGLQMVRSAPVLGVGFDHYTEEAGLVAHNSYLHAFAEMGLLGGGCFLGAVATALAGLYALCRDFRRVRDDELRRLHPFLMGAVVSYATGMLSLTLITPIPTWTMLALSAVYCRLAQADPPPPAVRIDGRFVQRVLVLSVVYLLCLYVFVRLAVSRG
jgi:putative inorganic carbon (hco3(-)) transporter